MAAPLGPTPPMTGWQEDLSSRGQKQVYNHLQKSKKDGLIYVDAALNLLKIKLYFFLARGVYCAKYPSPLEAEVLADVIRGKKLKRGEKKRRQEESQRIKGTLKLQE